MTNVSTAVFSIYTVCQNCIIPSISSCLLFGFTSRQMYSFSSCHKFSIGLKSGDSVGVHHQFMFFQSKNSLATCAWSVLGIVVLHESITSREIASNKWEQITFQHLNVEGCIHFSFKNANLCSSLFTDYCPYMDLNRVFLFGLQFWWLVYLLKTLPSVAFQLHRRFITPNYIIKVIVFSNALRSLFQSFCLVCRLY